MVKQYEFKDSPFMSAKGKHHVLRQWETFLKKPCWERFTRTLYEHLIGHCGFIAHYNRRGFYDVYFEEPSMTLKFLGQFDRTQNCRSVEFGDRGWLDHPDYRDINGAMVDVAEKYLSQLFERAAAGEISETQKEIQHLQGKLQLLEEKAAALRKRRRKQA